MTKIIVSYCLKIQECIDLHLAGVDRVGLFKVSWFEQRSAVSGCCGLLSWKAELLQNGAA